MFLRRDENLYCENYRQCFRKNDEGGLFPLKGKKRRIMTSDRSPSDAEGKYLTNFGSKA